MFLDNKSINVYWSDRLEALADKMFDECDQISNRDPFEKKCILVGDMATRNWLQAYFLLKKKPGVNRILANFDFKPLPEFINDWLAAFTHGTDSSSRRPSEHPYAKNILSWRIDAILKVCCDEQDFAFLKSYITGTNGIQSAKRRFALAERLAELFDDYLESRSGMLAQWERGYLPSGKNKWQALLYRKLVEKEPNTYVKDYEAAFDDNADPTRAFSCGFPKYSSIHAFDIAFAPWPYMIMLSKIAKVVPVTFWNFNPSREYWLDNPSKKQAMREVARSLQEALRKGEEPREAKPDLVFDSPDSKLLGALASGAKAMLAMELDLDENGCEWIGDVDSQDFDSIRKSKVELHLCHSPRRELEVIRDGLHRFFDENKDAELSDAIILCADWSKYSPLVESVFTSGSSASIPISIDGGVNEETPISHSLEQLFAFRDNRFEVNSVFELLAVPEIRSRFGLSSDDLSVLRDMVRKNNIHWGYDDNDVKRIVNEDDNIAYPFTWRRGLDRFIVDSMLGSRDKADTLVNIPGLGDILPCGNVEDERARAVGALNSFVIALNELRGFMLKAHSAEEWRDYLLNTIDSFYRADGEAIYELSALRRAIVATANSAISAMAIDGVESEAISGDVFSKAILSSIKSNRRRVSVSCDSVRFAPLNTGCAVPAKFVWICGVNDGQFPRMEYRPAFDMIGANQTTFDIASRDRDTFALLKAAMGARERLSFSYVGMDIHNNESIPAAVPLLDILDWMKSSSIEVKEYKHPLQSFSPQYFIERSILPPSYSSEDSAAAASLSNKDGSSNDIDLSANWPFKFSEGVTYLDIEDLIEFFRQPYRYLLRSSLEVSFSKTKYSLLSDEDSLNCSLPKELKGDLIVGGEAVVPDISNTATYLRESELSAPSKIIEQAIKKQANDGDRYRSRPLTYEAENADGYDCKDQKPIASAYLEWCNSDNRESYQCELKVKDGENLEHDVVVLAQHKQVDLEVLPSGTLAHTFNFSPWDEIYNPSLLESWIRHLVGHAAGWSFVTVNICTKYSPAQTFRPLEQGDAKEILSKIVAIAMKPFNFSRELAMQETIVDEDMPKDIQGLFVGIQSYVVKTGKYTPKNN